MLCSLLHCHWASLRVTQNDAASATGKMPSNITYLYSSGMVSQHVVVILASKKTQIFVVRPVYLHGTRKVGCEGVVSVMVARVEESLTMLKLRKAHK